MTNTPPNAGNTMPEVEKWAYRPKEHDDWGIVRLAQPDENGWQRVICQASYFASPEELTQHRINGTDPAEANARLIAAAPDLLTELEYAVRLLAPLMGGTAQVQRMRQVVAKARGE